MDTIKKVLLVFISLHVTIGCFCQKNNYIWLSSDDIVLGVNKIFKDRLSKSTRKERKDLMLKHSQYRIEEGDGVCMCVMDVYSMHDFIKYGLFIDHVEKIETRDALIQGDRYVVAGFLHGSGIIKYSICFFLHGNPMKLWKMVTTTIEKKPIVSCNDMNTLMLEDSLEYQYERLVHDAPELF